MSRLLTSLLTFHKGSSVLIFTDGSVYGGAVGSGACAAVLYPLSEFDNTIINTKATYA